MFERIAHLTRHVLDSAAVDSAAVDPRCDLRRRHPLLQVAFGRFEQVCLRSILVFMNLLSIVFFNFHGAETSTHAAPHLAGGSLRTSHGG